MSVKTAIACVYACVRSPSLFPHRTVIAGRSLDGAADAVDSEAVFTGRFGAGVFAEGIGDVVVVIVPITNPLVFQRELLAVSDDPIGLSRSDLEPCWCRHVCRRPTGGFPYFNQHISGLS